jgi:F-type H+-transporting ATPase subunit b
VNIVPNATVLITFALVWILVLVLSRVFFKPVGRILGERASRLESAKAETEKALAACEENLRQVEEELRKARTASAEMWDQAEREALKEKSRLVQDIQTECRAQVEKARRELEQHVEQLKKEIDAKTERMAEDIEHRILN